MPILDRYLIRAFAGPFVITLFMAWFVLLMQFLWFFLETIASKGLPFFTVVELIAYRSTSLLLVALPLAALLASVMTAGGLAERHELSSFHSAGVSDRRLLRPLLLMACLLAGFSYFTADYIVPAANFEFLRRLREAQLRDAAINIEPGVFNDDLPGYSILVRDKRTSGQLVDVLLYEEPPDAEAVDLRLTSSESGRLVINEQTQLAQLTLFGGSSIRETNRSGSGSKLLVRTNFASYERFIDLDEFSLPNFSQDASHYSLFTSWQLRAAADSIARKMADDRRAFSQSLPTYRSPERQPKAAVTSELSAAGEGRRLPPTIGPVHLNAARGEVRQIITRARSASQMTDRERETHVKYVYRKHEKYSLAIVCVLFVAVGGSLGGIIRSGNFGFPVLISIGVFVAYMMGSIFCRRLAESFVLHPIGAGWIPATVVCLLGFLLPWLKRR